MRKVDLLDRLYRMKRQLHESSGIYREMNHEQRQAADRSARRETRQEVGATFELIVALLLRAKKVFVAERASRPRRAFRPGQNKYA